MKINCEIRGESVFSKIFISGVLYFYSFLAGLVIGVVLTFLSFFIEMGFGSYGLRPFSGELKMMPANNFIINLAVVLVAPYLTKYYEMWVHKRIDRSEIDTPETEELIKREFYYFKLTSQIEVITFIKIIISFLAYFYAVFSMG